MYYEQYKGMSNEELVNKILNETIIFVKPRDEYISEVHNDIQQEAVNRKYDNTQ
jgi:hypothetical protein